MKFVSWNVNGFRAVLKKNFEEAFNSLNADFFCLQETKMQADQASFTPEGYKSVFFSAERKGYSGTAIFYKKEPNDIVFGIDGKHSDEGRTIALHYDDFVLVNCYVPNSQDGLKRLPYRMEFEDDLRKYLSDLAKKKPVIYCGDLNVAHNEIDLKNPKTNTMNPGFSNEERQKMTELLGAGFIDSFRELYPDRVKYSWWSYRMNAREKGIGWRIDYFIVSDTLKDKIIDSKIHDEIFGSDHCPVEIELNI